MLGLNTMHHHMPQIHFLGYYGVIVGPFRCNIYPYIHVHVYIYYLRIFGLSFNDGQTIHSIWCLRSKFIQKYWWRSWYDVIINLYIKTISIDSSEHLYPEHIGNVYRFVVACWYAFWKTRSCWRLTTSRPDSSSKLIEAMWNIYVLLY